MISPAHELFGGKYTLLTKPFEWTRHSVDCPVIFANHSKKRILDLSETKWQLKEFRETKLGIVLTLSKFPFHHHHCSLEINFNTETFHLNKRQLLPLSVVKEQLDGLNWENINN